MANVNKVMLLGNITRELEVRYTPKGTAVCDLGMAINRIRTGDNGERIEEVTYVDVTLWGRQAELAGQYLAKGRPVFIEGRLQLDQWDDKQTGQSARASGSLLRTCSSSVVVARVGRKCPSPAVRTTAPATKSRPRPHREELQRPTALTTTKTISRFRIVGLQ